METTKKFGNRSLMTFNFLGESMRLHCSVISRSKFTVLGKIPYENNLANLENAFSFATQNLLTVVIFKAVAFRDIWSWPTYYFFHAPTFAVPSRKKNNQFLVNHADGHAET